MAVTTKLTGFPKPDPNADLLGEIVTWDFAKQTIQYSDLVDSLRAANLDATVAREKCFPDNAFTRACKLLRDKRFISKYKEEGNEIRFQFTHKFDAGTHTEYVLEAMVALDKITGEITCKEPKIKDAAEQAVASVIGVRTANDVSQCIHRLVEGKRGARLGNTTDFIRLGKSGVFFVRKEAKTFIDDVETFCNLLQGNLMRLPIASGTENATRNVRDAVAEKMDELKQELAEEIESFGETTRLHTLQTAVDRVKVLRFKIESYSGYLGDMKADVDNGLTELTNRLKVVIREVLDAKEDAANEAPGFTNVDEAEEMRKQDEQDGETDAA